MWRPPKSLIDKRKLKGTPQHGIGRSCKVGKEEIVGLLTALRLFIAEVDAARHARWLNRLTPIQRGLAGKDFCRAEIEGAQEMSAVPQLVITLRSKPTPVPQLIEVLIAGSPSIHVEPVRRDQNALVINPMCFDTVSFAIILERILKLIL